MSPDAERGDGERRPDPELLAYQYVQALPQIAQSQGSTIWVIPSEVTTALKTLSRAFGNGPGDSFADRGPEVTPGPRPTPDLSDVRPAGEGDPIGKEPDDGTEPAAGRPPTVT